MENLVFTQLSIPEIRAILRQELQHFFESQLAQSSPVPSDALFTIQEASQFLNLSVPTLYGLVSRSAIPVNNKGKRLYFSKAELTEWIKAGRRKTVSELQAESANTYSQKAKKH